MRNAIRFALVVLATMSVNAISPKSALSIRQSRIGGEAEGGPKVNLKVYGDAVNCSAATLQYTKVMPANVCHNAGTHSVEWHCPGIPNTTSPACFAYQTFGDIFCGTPQATHINYCGECKENTLRVCQFDAADPSVLLQVVFANCTDDQCGTCAGGYSKDLTTVRKPRADAGAATGSPLGSTTLTQGSCQPTFNALGYINTAATLLPMTSTLRHCSLMLHDWWMGSSTCASGHGWDYIAQGICNAGWLIECE